MYGGAYLYPVGGLLYLLKSVGLFHPDRGIVYFFKHPNDIRNMYFAGRFLSLVGFLGVLLILGLMANRMDHPLTGSLSMATWATSTLPLNQALVSKPHVWAAFWIILAVYLLYCHYETARFRYLTWSGIAFGLGVGSNIFASAAGIIVILILVGRGPLWSWLSRVAAFLHC
jgi:hypothetical protein